MSDRVPLYLVGPPDGRLASVATALGDAAEFLEAAGSGAALAGRPPGVALLDADEMRVGDLMELMAALSPGDWTVALLTRDDPPSLRTLSLGAADPLRDVRRRAEDPESAPECLLDLNRALAEMSRLRHDLNNPLTAAMAETQLLLMDAREGEERESLESLLGQLRRIRDMLAASRYLRPRTGA